MQRDWAWHRFLRDLDNGAVATALARAQAGEDGLFVLRVEGGYVRDRGSFDPYAVEFRNTKAVYKFEYYRSSEECRLLEALDPANLMLNLKDTKSLPTAAVELTTLMSNAWLWIDVWLGLSVDVRTEQQGITPISASELWINHLQHLKEWVHPMG